jgi:iron complex outermembrane receptor protein
MEGTMKAAPLVALALAALLALAVPLSAQTLAGRVVDAATGTPIGARVEIGDTGESFAAEVDGRFAVPVAGAARVTLVFSHPGYYVQRVHVDVASTATLEVRLVPVVSLTDRVEVTATRAREGADPVSFTNVPQEVVEATYWGQDPAVLLSQLVPGMYASNDNGNGIGYSYFSIRGFGQARTRVMLNGAPLNDAESGELFFIDLADFMATAGDVQVQRGVFGLSGLGGAIDVTTALPPVTPQFSVHAGAGSYGTRRLTLKWDSGLVGGRWGLSARYSKITTDGYRDQSWVDSWNYYFALARYGERSRVRVTLFGGPEQTHLAYVGVPQAALDGKVTGDAGRDRRINPLTYPGEIDNFFQPHYQFAHDLTISPRAKLAQTAYVFLGDGYYDQFRARRSLFEYDLPNVVLPGGEVITRTDLVRRRTVDEWDAGWVPSFSYESGRWGLDLQGEIRLHRAHHFGEVTWAQYYPTGVAPNHRYYDYEVAKTTAVGGAGLRYALTPRLALTGGLQLAHHQYEMDEDQLNGVELDEPFTFVLPRAGAVYKLGETANAYVGVARGMREPFFRSIYDPQDHYSTPVTLDPEDVWNVEGGLSVQRARWRMRGNVFWMRFLNEIVYAGALDDNGVPVYGNGAKSRRVGVEADGSWTIVPSLVIDGALSLSRNTFTDYREYDFEGGSVVYDGNRIAGFPDVMGSLAARWSWRGHQVTAAVRHVGRFYLDNTERADRVNPAYTVADLAARIALPAAWGGGAGLTRVGLDLRVNNLFDQEYTSFGYVDGVPLYIPAAGRNVYAGLTVTF